MFELPLFPLRTVLFPETPINLHIFEPRYRLMIRRCLENQQPFGVLLIRKGMEALGPLAAPFDVGCTARIVESTLLEDGSFDLTAVGEERIRILEFDYSQPYLIGKVEIYQLEEPQNIHIMRACRPLLLLANRYLKILHALGEPTLDLNKMQLPEDPLLLMYLSASLLQIPAIEKQPLLEAPRAADLMAQLQRLYKRENAVLPRLQGTSQQVAERAAWLN
jgi:uncharacterized protein